LSQNFNIEYCGDGYAYCGQGPLDIAPNCGEQTCGTNTYRCTNDGTTWAWRLTPPAEVCGDEIDNDCDDAVDVADSDIECCVKSDCTDPDKPYCSPENKCVECLSNDRADGTSSQCFNRPGFENQYLRCDTVNYWCVEAPCLANSECDAGYCCDKSQDIVGGLPPEKRGTGVCVKQASAEGLRQPYLCTS
jgi:hypothetical protein